MTGVAPIVEVRGLTVDFGAGKSALRAVAGVDVTLQPGETLALLGESGSGKSVTLRALLRLHPKSARIGGQVHVAGRDVLAMPARELSAFRGGTASMIFQDPGLAFDPVYRVGDQIAEAVRAHADVSKHAALTRAVELLDAVGLPNARARSRDYPHQFSGGMRQRAMIAMALVNDPDVLIADEPTTALDVTVQAQILALIDTVKRDFDIGVILVTHDLGVIAETADTVMVMYAGRTMELGPARELFRVPQHPYTWGLLDSMPTIQRRLAQLTPIEGSPPSLITPPPGCPFHPRCTFRFDRCDQELPRAVADGLPHLDACLLPQQRKLEQQALRAAARQGTTP